MPTHPHRPAHWLNGSAWAFLMLCLLAFISLRGTLALWAFLVGLAVAGLGTAANLVLCLRCYARGHRQQAQQYLVGLLTLAIPFGTLCFALAEATRFDE